MLLLQGGMQGGNISSCNAFGMMKWFPLKITPLCTVSLPLYDQYSLIHSGVSSFVSDRPAKLSLSGLAANCLFWEL